MTREEVYRDIKETLGLVPTYMKRIPDEYIAEEWDLFKRLQLGETHIPNKYKELMGVALSAATRCEFCTLYHTEAAKMHGATDEEIEEAAHFAKHSAGWSVYLHGIQADKREFKSELHRVMDHVQKKARKRAA